MKKYYHTFWIYILAFGLVAFTLTVTTGQEKQPTSKKQLPVTDSTISLKDLQTFNEVLRKSISYDQYIKLTPEQVLTELWGWKLRQLSDTTKKK